MPDDSIDRSARRLQAIRNEIDALDISIQSLINHRAGLAHVVARIKRAALEFQQEGEQTPSVYYRPEREAQVLRQLLERNQGPLSDQAIVAVFREIMSACLALQQPLSVVYLGPEGTFTHAATLRHFGHQVDCQPMTTIDEVFREIEVGASSYGVVPVENSTEGMVNHTLDCFIRSPLKICGEVALHVHHHLLAQKGVEPNQIQSIYSHQQGLAQCRNWLDRHFPGVNRIQVSSTAEAARIACDDKTTAAIAGDMAMRHYELMSLSARIEDRPDNKTRFLILGQREAAASGQDKTSILIYAKNEPGALYRVLGVFDKYRINLTRIESRPTPGRGGWSYVFFMDFDNHEQDDNLQSLLDEIMEHALELKNLGSYPREVGRTL